ncbi:MAG: hypothetical protein MUE49_08335 [Rhodospirillales bacterium]|jgi:hypothetical protein|nr:hypothetical protein [Rhodospirillales bacterium]
MSRLSPTAVDHAERSLGYAILLVAHARAHLARRGHFNSQPLASALADVGGALAVAGGEITPRLMIRVKALIEGLAFLATEMRDRGENAAPRGAVDTTAAAEASPLSAVA